MKYSKFLFLSLLFVLPMLQSCKDDDMPTTDACTSDFDQAAMFQNIADNIIIPKFAVFQNTITDLSEKITAFTDTPNLENLDATRVSFIEAYGAWQEVAQYNFGPAEDVFLRSSVNNFPLNEQAVETNISSGSHDFSQPDNYDKGLPALDYLLFGLDEDSEALVAFYTTNPNASNYKQYLIDLITDIQERTDYTFETWDNSYRSSFIANTGTAAGSSLSLLINHLNQNYELIKREKLGVPSGVLTLGFTNPDKVEAYHSGISAELAYKALVAAKSLYQGNNGQGLDDYLEAVGAQKNNGSLNTLILERFDVAIQTVSNLGDPLSETIETDVAAVENAYNEVVKQIVNIKTDMPSVLCVSITYIDNPSDSD